MIPANEGSAPAGPSTPQIVQRIASLPLVSTTLSTLSSLYQHYGKESDVGVVRDVLGKAEDTAARLSAAAVPIINPYWDKIAAIDTYTCDKFDKLSSKVTSTTEYVRELPKKVNERTTEVLSSLSPQSVEDAAIATLDSLFETKEKAISRISGTATNTVHLIEVGVTSVTSRVLDVADSIVDRVVPAVPSALDTRSFADVAGTPATASASTTEEPQHRARVGAETAKVLRKARTMTSKVQTRLYARALNQIQFAKRRSQEAIDSFRPYVVNLIDYAEDILDEAGAEEEEEEGDETKRSKEDEDKEVQAKTAIDIVPTPQSEQLAQRLQSASRKILVNALHQAIRSRRWAVQKVAVLRLRLHIDSLKPSALAATASDMISSARVQVFSITANATKLVHERALALQPAIPDLAAKVSTTVKSSIDHIHTLYDDKRLIEGLLEDLEGAKAALLELVKHLPLGSYLVLNKDAKDTEQIVAVNTGNNSIDVLSVHEVEQLRADAKVDAGSKEQEEEVSEAEEAEEEEEEAAPESDEQDDGEKPVNASFLSQSEY